MSEVVYSAQRSGFVKGRIYLNPRFFDGVLQPGASSVIVVGKWPTVVASYEAAGIKVRQVNQGDKLPSTNEGGDDNVSREVTTEHKASVVKGSGKKVGDIEPPLKKGNNVEMPENFDDLSFRDMKALMAKIGDGGEVVPDVKSKAEAVEFLEAYKKGKAPPEGDDD